jgi:methionine-rich copper-binding protein CopC
MSLVRKVASAILGASLIVGSIAPAWSHTDVASTTPKDGSAVEAGSNDVSVSFNDKILNLADSSEIVVVDSENRPLKVECLKVEGKQLQAVVYLETAGDYRVTWRTVAEDGHPLTGKFSFSVTGTPALEYVRPACAGPEPTQEPEVPVEPTQPVDSSSRDTTPFTLGALFLAVTVSIVFFELIRRRKKRSKA